MRLQVQQARRIIAFTGAGISTACGIPDFRGPNGIWTLQRAGQPLPRPKVSFTHAKPSLTHQVQPHAGRWLPLCSRCAIDCMGGRTAHLQPAATSQSLHLLAVLKCLAASPPAPPRYYRSPQVLVALMQAGKLDYLVSQNVDGLHLRSGIPRDRLAELHGNCFAERCHTCGGGRGWAAVHEPAAACRLASSVVHTQSEPAGQ